VKNVETDLRHGSYDVKNVDEDQWRCLYDEIERQYMN
jgi:hypothetical protein